jgi:hypothetical protein
MKEGLSAGGSRLVRQPGAAVLHVPSALLLVRILFSCANSGLGYWPRPVPCGGKTILNHGGHGDHGDGTRKTDGEDLGEPGLALYCRWRIGSFSVSSVTSVVSEKEIWLRPSGARPRWVVRGFRGGQSLEGRMMIRPYGPPSPAPARLAGSSRENFSRNVDFLCNIQTSRSVYIWNRRWRWTLGTARPQDVVFPAARIKARHEIFRLKSFSALLTAALVVTFVTKPEGVIGRYAVRSSQLLVVSWKSAFIGVHLRLKRRLIVGGRNVQNEPNSRRCRVGRGPRGVGRGANAQNEPNFANRDKGRTRKTNPISSCPGPAARKVSEEVGRGRPTYEEPDCAKRTQFRRSAGAPEGEMCETNPISAGRDTPLFHHSGVPVACLLCETKPISAGAGWDAR